MMHPDAARWNDRYRQDGESWLNSRPRQLLLDYAYLLPRQGLALDAAAGVAVHGLFLAEHGLKVIALDISEVGLRLARRISREKGIWLDTAVLDLAHLWLPEAAFDVILNFRFLDRGTFPVYQQALKPGGLLFFETFVQADPAEPHPDYYLFPGELKAAFSSWDLLHWTEKGGSCHGRSPKITAQLIARKPEGLVDR